MRDPAGRLAGTPAGRVPLERAVRAGNRAVVAVVARQRLQRRLYETPARAMAPLPAAAVRAYRRHGRSGDPQAALRAVVGAMTRRGDLDRRLLATRRTGRGLPSRPLWRVARLGRLGAGVSFAPAFTADDGRTRLPNPRFTVDPRLLDGRRTHLPLLHSALLHEFRHVRQRFERLNAGTAGRRRPPGYCNDPDEFDAYLAEVEAGYDAAAVIRAAVRAAVTWQRLDDADRAPFRRRWQAAQRSFQTRFGYPLTTVLRTSMAQRFRAVCQAMARRARAAAGASR